MFADMRFAPTEAAELTVNSARITLIGDTIKACKLTHQEAAPLCGADQPTVSNVLRGRMESVTIDRLTAWLTALGRDGRDSRASLRSAGESRPACYG